MAVFQTVLGDINNEMIEHAQCHEHIWLGRGRSAEINPALCIDDFHKSLKELLHYKEAGGDLIVDAQPLGCGRDADVLYRLSERSGVAIVASTGFHKLIFYPDSHWIHVIGSELFASKMIQELEEGMFVDGDSKVPTRQTSIKAGMIKVAIGEEDLTSRYTRLFRAAAMASVKTGISIQCHIDKSGQGDMVSDFLIREGVEPRKIILAHMDRAEKDVGQMLKVLAKGVYLQFDTIGRFKYHSDEEEITLINKLCQAGYEKQMLIGLDTTRTRLLSYEGEVGLTYILKTFMPKLRASNISSKRIHQLIKYNPGHALGCQ